MPGTEDGTSVILGSTNVVELGDGLRVPAVLAALPQAERGGRRLAVEGLPLRVVAIVGGTRLGGTKGLSTAKALSTREYHAL